MFNVRVLSRSYRKFISFLISPFLMNIFFMAYTHLADFFFSPMLTRSRLFRKELNDFNPFRELLKFIGFPLNFKRRSFNHLLNRNILIRSQMLLYVSGNPHSKNNSSKIFTFAFIKIKFNWIFNDSFNFAGDWVERFN